MPVNESDNPTTPRRVPPWAGYRPDPPDAPRIKGAPWAGFIPEGHDPTVNPVQPEPVQPVRRTKVAQFTCEKCDAGFGSKHELKEHVEGCKPAESVDSTVKVEDEKK